MTRSPAPQVLRFALALASSLCLSLSVLSSADSQAPFFEPGGYRIDRFRAPVPDSLPGAATLHTRALVQLVESAAPPPILIDVLPAPPRPEGLAATSLWLPPSREDIPGSVWLPNVGYGRLSDALDRYFRANLARLTEGDPARPIVIYCQAECWMSWNAARRAVEYGYGRVIWYPEGTDGWQAAGLPLEAATPVPME